MLTDVELLPVEISEAFNTQLDACADTLVTIMPLTNSGPSKLCSLTFMAHHPSVATLFHMTATQKVPEYADPIVDIGVKIVDI